MGFLRQELWAHKLIFVSGKGGCGKSLLSAALGLLASSEGQQTLLVENAVTEQLSPLLGLEPVGAREIALNSKLSCLNLDAETCFRDYVVQALGKPRLYEKLLKNKLVWSFIAAIPGLKELMLLGKLRSLSRRYDFIIFDAPASGHFLGLLSTPQAILNSGLGGPIKEEVQKIYDFVFNQKLCATYLVSLPDPLVVNETLDLIERLKIASPIKIAGTFVNRAYAKGQLDDLRVLSKNDRSFSACYEQLQAQFKQRAAGSSELRASLQALHLPLLELADMGTIVEPLAGAFVDNYLAVLR